MYFYSKDDSTSQYLPLQPLSANLMLQLNYMQWVSRKNDSIHVSEIFIQRYYYHAYYYLTDFLTGVLQWWCWKHGYCYYMEYVFQIRYYPQKLDFCSDFVCGCLLSWGKKVCTWCHVATNDVCSNCSLWKMDEASRLKLMYVSLIDNCC